MDKVPTNPDSRDTETEEAVYVKSETSEDPPIMDRADDAYFYGALRSDVGSVRERNEDACFLFNSDSGARSPIYPFALCIVADGMGGYEGGDRASKIASRTNAQYLLQQIYLPALNGQPQSDPAYIQQIMGRSILAAHEAILSPDYLGNGGTTLTTALLLGGQLYLAHVGDSRAYWLVDGELQRLTKDHSLVQRLQDEGKLTAQEAVNFQYRNILLRALGQEEDLLVDVDMHMLPPHGKLLLCSDGLSGEVSDAEIQGIMNQALSPDQIADQLITKALEAGGWDNISVIVAEFVT